MSRVTMNDLRKHELESLIAAGRVTQRGPVKVFCEAYPSKPGYVHVKLWKGKLAKPFANYLLKEDRANAYIAEQVEAVRYAAEAAQNRRNEAKGKADEMAARLEVGTILHNSWGYDQTNCDYYQVVAKSGKTVQLREIAGEQVEGSEGFMSCRLRPVKDRFINDKVITKRITAYGVSFEFGGCSVVTENDTHYSSWYA